MISQHNKHSSSNLVMQIREHFFPGITLEQQELIGNIPSDQEKKLGTVIVTGAASGIGKDCVLNALVAGYKVLALDLADVDLGREFRTSRVISYQVDVTSNKFHAALEDSGVITDPDPVFVISAAGVYSDTDFDKCRRVNFEACANVLITASEMIPNLEGASIVASDQSYFDKNTQHQYGTPYMNSKQLLRDWYEKNTFVLPERLAFIAPATVITSLTAAVFNPVASDDNSSSLQSLLPLWQAEQRSIPEGLLNPHHLADVILKAATLRGVVPTLIDAIKNRRGVLLDGKLCAAPGIKVVSESYERFSLIDANNVPVVKLMDFESYKLNS